MIVKVDLDLDCMTFGISSIRILDSNNVGSATYSMICCFNSGDVRSAFTSHVAPYTDALCVVIEFYDGRIYEVDFHEDNKMRNMEKFISHIFKMKMLDTKWEKEHPEQYI